MTESQMLIAGIVALAGAVALLYKRAEDKSDARYNELKTRVDDCEEDRQKLWSKIEAIMSGDFRTDP